MTREEFIENIKEIGFYNSDKSIRAKRGYNSKALTDNNTFFYDYADGVYICIAVDFLAVNSVKFYLDKIGNTGSSFNAEIFHSYDEAWEYLCE